MANTLRLEIVTPLEKAFSDDVQMVVIPGVEGEMGIYPMHIPVMTEIKPGELKIIKDGQESDFAVGEGFVEIAQDHVTVLTDMAIAESAMQLEDDQLCNFAPGLAIASSRHETQYSRLLRS